MADIGNDDKHYSCNICDGHRYDCVRLDDNGDCELCKLRGQIAVLRDNVLKEKETILGGLDQSMSPTLAFTIGRKIHELDQLLDDTEAAAYEHNKRIVAIAAAQMFKLAAEPGETA